MCFVGSHLRLYASAANGRKNAKNRATVNNNNTNDSSNKNASKLTQNASVKAAQTNFVNKQQSQPIKTQSTIINVDEKSKTEKPATTILYSKNLKENAQNKPNDESKGKSDNPGKIVNDKKKFRNLAQNFARSVNLQF